MSSIGLVRKFCISFSFAAWKHKLLPSILAAALGGSIVFAMGFTESSLLHNAAHDGRHSAGFPCH